MLHERKKERDLKSVGAAEKEIGREREREVIWEWMNKERDVGKK